VLYDYFQKLTNGKNAKDETWPYINRRAFLLL
jgi:hypothetical protein